MTSLAQPGPLDALDMDSPRCQVPLEKNPACSSWEQDLHPPLYCLCPRTAVPLPPWTPSSPACPVGTEAHPLWLTFLDLTRVGAGNPIWFLD